MSDTGNTRSRAFAGRGIKASSSGSSMLKTSWKERAGDRPSSWINEVMTSGLFSMENQPGIMGGL